MYELEAFDPMSIIWTPHEEPRVKCGLRRLSKEKGALKSMIMSGVTKLFFFPEEHLPKDDCGKYRSTNEMGKGSQLS